MVKLYSNPLMLRFAQVLAYTSTRRSGKSSRHMWTRNSTTLQANPWRMFRHSSTSGRSSWKLVRPSVKSRRASTWHRQQSLVQNPRFDMKVCIYEFVVKTSLLYGYETWPWRVEDQHCFEVFLTMNASTVSSVGGDVTASHTPLRPRLNASATPAPTVRTCCSSLHWRNHP